MTKTAAAAISDSTNIFQRAGIDTVRVARGGDWVWRRRDLFMRASLTESRPTVKWAVGLGYNEGMAGECHCPKIDLNDWRDREVTLAGHAFLAAPTPLFFHVPRRLYRDLESLEIHIQQRRYRAGAFPMVLHRDGWFSGEVLLSIEPQSQVSPEVLSFQNLFYSRVVSRPGFDAALREMPRFYRDLSRARVGRIVSMYFWYLTCPRCLVVKGAEQVILLARSNKLLSSKPCPLETAAPSRAALPCQV